MILFRQLFKHEMHNTLVSNLFKCGVLSENVRERLENELRVDVEGNLPGDE